MKEDGKAQFEAKRGDQEPSTSSLGRGSTGRVAEMVRQEWPWRSAINILGANTWIKQIYRGATRTIRKT
jgi:hypothetical protein